MNLMLVFDHGDAILVSVFLSLLLMAFVTWGLIIWRGLGFLSDRKQQRQLLEQFWQTRDGKSARKAIMDESDSALARITRSSVQAAEKYQNDIAANQTCSFDDYITRNIRQALAQEMARLENGMIVLATVGSIAPFVGLFGTVWGIYRALIGIAAAGQVSISTVSGPIGEALVATAAGLAAAIPAVIAYNAFLRSNRVLSQEMDNFAHDLHAQLLSEHSNSKGN